MPTTWYIVSATKKDNVITHVGLRLAEGEKETVETKENFITILEHPSNKGSTAYTYRHGPTGIMPLVQRVHVVERDGTKYLSTDPNNTTKDNLGDLPPCPGVISW